MYKIRSIKHDCGLYDVYVLSYKNAHDRRKDFIDNMDSDIIHTDLIHTSICWLYENEVDTVKDLFQKVIDKGIMSNKNIYNIPAVAKHEAYSLWERYNKVTEALKKFRHDHVYTASMYPQSNKFAEMIHMSRNRLYFFDDNQLKNLKPTFNDERLYQESIKIGSEYTDEDFVMNYYKLKPLNDFSIVDLFYKDLNIIDEYFSTLKMKTVFRFDLEVFRDNSVEWTIKGEKK